MVSFLPLYTKKSSLENKQILKSWPSPPKKKKSKSFKLQFLNLITSETFGQIDILLTLYLTESVDVLHSRT
jgi:hypothetical protein